MRAEGEFFRDIDWYLTDPGSQLDDVKILRLTLSCFAAAPVLTVCLFAARLGVTLA